MHCEDVHTLLPELARDELNPAADARLREHLTQCRSCAVMAQREAGLLVSLKALPIAAMPEGFAARALRQAVIAGEAQERQTRQRPTRQRLQVFAAAASLLLVCGLAFMLGRGSNPLNSGANQQVAVNVPLGITQMVALKIDAPHAFDEVKFEVSLPQNVALADQPELRQFAWSGQLQAGLNVLSLPLVGVVPADGQLIATVKYGKTTRSLSVPLSVVKQG